MATYGTKYIDIAFLERSPFRKKHLRLSKDDLSEEEITFAEKHGILEVIVARPVKRGATTIYEMLDGERSWLLAQAIQAQNVVVQIVPMTDTTAREYVQQSEDRMSQSAPSTVSPLTTLRALPSPQKNKTKTGMTRNQQAVNSHRRALLRKLHPHVLAMYDNGEISEGHARAIKAQGISKQQQLILAKRIIRKELSTVRETEAAVREILQGFTPFPGVGSDSDRHRLEEKIARKLGYPTKYRKGWLQLYIGEKDEANALLEKLGVTLDD